MDDDTVPVFTAQETILLMKGLLDLVSKEPDLMEKLLSAFAGKGAVTKGNDCSIIFKLPREGSRDPASPAGEELIALAVFKKEQLISASVNGASRSV